MSFFEVAPELTLSSKDLLRKQEDDAALDMRLKAKIAELRMYGLALAAEEGEALDQVPESPSRAKTAT
jgi:hypothetical protein